MKSIADIKAIRDKMQAEIIARDTKDNDDIRVVVGMATCGIAAGAREVFASLMDEVSKRNLKNVKISRAGCLGMCKLEPIVEVYVPGKPKCTYIKLDADKAKNIVVNHLVNGNEVTEYMITND